MKALAIPPLQGTDGNDGAAAARAGPGRSAGARARRQRQPARLQDPRRRREGAAPLLFPADPRQRSRRRRGSDRPRRHQIQGRRRDLFAPRQRSHRRLRRVCPGARKRRGEEARAPRLRAGSVASAGGAYRLAGADRTRTAAGGTEGPDPRRLGRRRHLRHPAGQTPRRAGRDHGQRQEPRAGEVARRGCGHRLPDHAVSKRWPRIRTWSSTRRGATRCSARSRRSNRAAWW